MGSASPSGSFKRKERTKSTGSIRSVRFSSSGESISVRRIKAGDHDSIITFSDETYKEHDSLPLIFHQMLKQKKNHLFIAISGKRIVGCMLVTIVDADKTLAMSGMRIHPDYKRRNISHFLRNGMYDFIRKTYPSVERERFTACTNGPYVATLRTQLGYRKLAETKVVSVFISQDMRKLLSLVLKSLVSEPQGVLLDQITPEEALEFAVTNNSFFPENTVLVDCIPYSVIPSNVPSMFSGNDKVLVERAPTQTKTGSWLERLISVEPRPLSFSHGRVVPRLQCNYWEATLYGSNRDALRSHLIGQLQNALECTSGHFVFTSIHDDCNTGLVREFLHHYLGLRYDDDHYLSDLVVYERPLNWTD